MLRKTVVRATFAFIAIMVLFGLGRAAQDGSLTISVKDKDGNAIAGAKVAFTNCKDPQPCPDGTKTCSSGHCEDGADGKCCTDQSFATDESGTATFKGAVGTYRVTIESSGFAKETIPNVVIQMGQSSSLDVTLRKDEGVKRRNSSRDYFRKAIDELKILAGKVVNEDNQPQANVVVRVTSSGCKTCPDGTQTCSSGHCVGGVKNECCPDQFAITNQRGEYVITNIDVKSSLDVTYIKDGLKQGRSALGQSPDDKLIMNVKLEQLKTIERQQ